MTPMSHNPPSPSNNQEDFDNEPGISISVQEESWSNNSATSISPFSQSPSVSRTPAHIMQPESLSIYPSMSSFTHSQSSSVTHTPVYPFYETAHVNTYGLSQNFLPVPTPDTSSHSAPASPSRASKTFSRPQLNLDHPNWQQSSLSTGELSPFKTRQFQFDTQHPSTAPAGQTQGFLQLPRQSYHRRTTTTASPPNLEYLRSSAPRRKSFSSYESSLKNTNMQPVPNATTTYSTFPGYRQTSPHLSDTSSAGSPSPSFSGHDSSTGSPNPPTAFETTLPASPSIAVVDVDAFHDQVNSPATGPDFSPSVGSASPSGSISNLGRSFASATNSLTDLSDVASEIDLYSPLNHLFNLDSYPFQQQHQQFSESELRVDGNTSNYSLDNSLQQAELHQHQDVDRPVPSVTLTPAAPGTPPNSMLFSLPPAGDGFPTLSPHPPLTDSNPMGGVTYLGQMPYDFSYCMGINPSTLSLPDSMIEPLIIPGFEGNPPDEGVVSLYGYPHPPDQTQLPTFERQEVSSTSTAGSSQPQRHISPEQALQEHTLEDKLKVYQILTSSSKRAEINSRIREAVKKGGRPLSQIYHWAFRRRVKLTAASEAKAKERRTRDATFQCLLCEAFLTTNNNLQNHYRSHLCLNPYRCKRCGKEYRTDGSLNRHLNSSKGMCPRRNRISEQN